MNFFGERIPTIEIDEHLAQDDPSLRRAFDAARGGDWTHARELMASVRSDYDRRARYVWVLAESTTAVRWSRMVPASGPAEVDIDSAWTDRWAAAEPDNADAHLVRARSLIMRAWQVRGSGWASTVGRSAADEFIRLLQIAAHVNDQAAALAPDDPTPWVERLLVMTALAANRATFERGWSEVVARDPFHREAHSLKLMYLCRKWHGSHDDMFHFARAAAEAAPDGSPLHVLPVQANAEWAMWEMYSEGKLSNYKRVGDVWRKDPVFQGELDNALDRWFRRPTIKHAMWHHDLNFLAYGLSRGRRDADAKAVFQAIGPYCEDIPWGWWDKNLSAHKGFLNARKHALRS